MLKIPPPSWFKFAKKTAAVIFVAESLAFAGSYLVWYRLNTNRDFRKYCNENYPAVLEGYYKIGGFFDTDNSIAKIRQRDVESWYPPSLKEENLNRTD